MPILAKDFLGRALANFAIYISIDLKHRHLRKNSLKPVEQEQALNIMIKIL